MFNIWCSEKRKDDFNIKYENSKTGLYLKIDRHVDKDVKRACKEFAVWCRKEYQFPIRVVVYVKDTYRIKAKDGEMVCGTFFWTDRKSDEPYIRIATGDYEELRAESNQDNALASILWTLIHELTHYFQWLNEVDFDDTILEKMAERDADQIFERYTREKEHL